MKSPRAELPAFTKGQQTWLYTYDAMLAEQAGLARRTGLHSVYGTELVTVLRVVKQIDGRLVSL